MVQQYLWDVFVSYSHKNASECLVISSDLRRLGFRVWRDDERISAGQRLRAQIADGLQRSRCIAMLLSAHSLKSEWCLNELDSGMLREIAERKTIVVPVLLGRIRDDQLPSDLRGKKYIDLRHGFQKAYRARRHELLSAIRLETDSSNSGVVMIGTLGKSTIAHLLSLNREEGVLNGLRDEAWNAMIRTFWSPDSKSSVKEEVAWFREEFGQEAMRGVLAYFFGIYRVNLLGGFTEQEFDRAANHAEMFMIMVVASVGAMKDGMPGIEYGLSDAGEVVYRVSGT